MRIVLYGIAFSLHNGTFISENEISSEEDIYNLDGKFLLEFDYENGIRVLYTTLYPMFIDVRDGKLYKHLFEFKNSRRINENFIFSLYDFLRNTNDGKQNIHSKIYNPSSSLDIRNFRYKKLYNDKMMFQTCFKNVVLLPPYSKIKLVDNKIVEVEDYSLAKQTLTAKKIIDISISLMKNHKNPLLFLSAGYDSRVLYDILDTQNISFCKYTDWDSNQIKFVSDKLLSGNSIQPTKDFNLLNHIEKLTPYILEYDGMVNFLDLYPYIKFSDKTNLFLSGSSLLMKSLNMDFNFLGLKSSNHPMYKYINFFQKSFDSKVGINRNIFSYSPFDLKMFYRYPFKKQNVLEDFFKELNTQNRNRNIGFITTSDHTSEYYMDEQYERPSTSNILYSFLLYVSVLYENDDLYNKNVNMITNHYMLSKTDYVKLLKPILEKTT